MTEYRKTVAFSLTISVLSKTHTMTSKPKEHCVTTMLICSFSLAKTEYYRLMHWTVCTQRFQNTTSLQKLALYVDTFMK